MKEKSMVVGSFISHTIQTEDICDIPILEVDLLLLPNGTDDKINEKIKEQFENS